MIYETLAIFLLTILGLIITKKHKYIITEFQKLYKYNLLIIKSFKIDRQSNIKLIYKKIFNLYFTLIFKTIVLLIPFVAVYFFGNEKFLNYIFSVKIILISLILVIFINFISTSERYDFLSILIHRIFFSFDFFNIFLFDLEKKIYLPKFKIKEKNLNVFITGLPRSGTTAFLELLYSSKQFASFQYLDMPFLLSPNLRKNFMFNYNKNFNKIERYHQDKIYINKNSPEAFDEVFFRIFDSQNYIKKNNLEIYTPQENVLENYKNLINLCKISKKKIDICLKIITTLLVLKSYQNTLIMIFFILFRDPLDFAISSEKTHKKFLTLQSQNNFIKNYMKFLGHYEFGLERKHINFEFDYEYEKKPIDYWIKYWIHIYAPYRSKELNKNINLVCYEKIKQIEYKLLSYLKLEKFNYNFLIPKKISRDVILEKLNVDKKLLKESYSVYQDLSEIAF